MKTIGTIIISPIIVLAILVVIAITFPGCAQIDTGACADWHVERAVLVDNLNTQRERQLAGLANSYDAAKTALANHDRERPSGC